MTLLDLEMVILTMPLSIIHVPPLSVIVTGALTSTLATTGASSAARSDDADSAREIKTNIAKPLRPTHETVLNGMTFIAGSNGYEFRLISSRLCDAAPLEGRISISSPFLYAGICSVLSFGKRQVIAGGLKSSQCGTWGEAPPDQGF